ncbi:ABC transporter permease [Cutibacterium sp. WCA-380-WT-3A]|uniref:ABC transporter permease n=1 Tax=Cutibacterium porci TaxID=2605781 RepID=A0A7K0JA69_9ACTN|nr:ABC transporter permease [Cutibacterium porci]MSS46648.1 ABC transporter permease [Cutibacterium porci]
MSETDAATDIPPARDVVSGSSPSPLSGEASSNRVPAADIGRVAPSGVWGRLRRNGSAMFGAVIVVVTILVAVLATPITRMLGLDPYSYDLSALDASGLPAGPMGGISMAHPFGVEPQTGRDLFAIVVEGTRTSFFIGMGATILSMIIAIIVGVTAGYFGGWWDGLASRGTDVILGFPQLVFMIAISAVIPATAPRVTVMVLIIGLLGWPSTARVLRSQAMSLRSRTFIRATQAMGASQLHILVRQMLPNLVATIIVFTTISIPGKIGAEAALSFLGVGVTPPTPSWGRSIGSAVTWVNTDPWYLLFPGGALFLVTLAFNLFGDGLRDAIDPRLGEAR